jgi:hypothetical protein
VADLVRYALSQQQFLLHAERQRREQESLDHLHEAEKAYRTAARRYHELVELANAASWRTDEDGQQALYSAHTAERDTMERYIKALQVFTNLIVEGRKPASNTPAHPSGQRHRPPGGGSNVTAILS